MKEVTLTFRYTGEAETWDEIREDAEQGKIKNVFIGKKEFVNAELIAELEAKCSRLESYNAELQRTIKSLQAQIPKRGEWMRADLPDAMTNKCSLCGYEVWDEYRYCPNCGAKMKGENDEQADC
jgi:hypothetical protein